MNKDREKIHRTKRTLKPAEPKPRLNQAEALRIIGAIDCSDVSGMQTRALMSLMFFNHLRFSDALGLKSGDVFWEAPHPYLLIPMKRMADRREDKFALTCAPEALQALNAYIKKANLVSDKESPLFRTIDRRTREITSKALSARAAQFLINQGARRAGIEREVWPHEFRIAGASLLKNQIDNS